MLMTWIAFAVGIFIGFAIGIMISGLFIMARDRELLEIMEKDRSKKDKHPQGGDWVA